MLWTDDEGHVLQYVDALVHDALSPSDAKIAADHCHHCPICQTAREQAYKRMALLQTIPPVEASEALVRATEEKIVQYRARWITPARVGWSLAAAAVLCMAALHIRHATLAPTPYELTILGQTEWIADSQGSLRVRLTDHHTRQPLANAPVEINLADKARKTTVQLAVFTTDALGTGQPRFRLPAWNDGSYELQVYARAGSSVETIVREVKLHRSWQLMLTSDKPVYQPGQTIRLRSLALGRPDLKPVAGQTVSYSVGDPKGNVIFRTREATSRFGIASTDCPLADEIAEGAYRIECTLGDTTSSLSVDVRKYVLPKFKVDMSLDQPYLLPGQKIRVSVEAHYFFGKPVTGAEVELLAQSRDVDVATFGTHTARTNDQGSAQFETTLPAKLFGRPQTDGDAEIRLVVNVRDSAGQKVTKSFLRVVAAQPIRVEVIPEAGRLVRGVPNTIYLFTTYPNGQPAQTRIAVTGVDRELKANTAGRHVVRVHAPVRHRHLHLPRNRATKAEPAGARSPWIPPGPIPTSSYAPTRRSTTADRPCTCWPWAAAAIRCSSTSSKTAKQCSPEVIPIENGQGRFDLDLPPDLFRHDRPVRLPLRPRRLAREQEPRAVRASAPRALDPNPMGQALSPRRPRQARLPAHRRSRPAQRPAPLSLSPPSTRPCFSTLGYRPAMDQTFFTLEQELLKPVYANLPLDTRYRPEGLAPPTPKPRTSPLRPHRPTTRQQRTSQ